MEEYSLKETSVLLFDSFDEDSKMLYQSFLKAGFQGLILTCSDDGFLPENVLSIYTLFLGKKEGRPRYFNEIDIPDYWEIKSSNTQGQIYDLTKERAKIFYTNPSHKRFVRVVDWYDEDKQCRLSEHYDRYGTIYAQSIFNHEGKLITRSYFDVNQKEILVENYVTKNIILNLENQILIFKNKVEFICFVFQYLGITVKRLFYNSLSTPFFVSEALPKSSKEDILFWQEGVRSDIPGNMSYILNGNANRTSKIYVQKKESYEKFISLGVNPTICKPLGFIYSFLETQKKENTALICTNSDQIEKLKEIVEACGEIEFHIVALTEMSSKLIAFERYKNVNLYPTCKESTILKLFNFCSYYLDINHANEIVDACKEAFLHNCLLLSFKNTCHNKKYVLKDCCFDSFKVQNLIETLKNKDAYETLLKEQRTSAMSQNIEDYNDIIYN